MARAMLIITCVLSAIIGLNVAITQPPVDGSRSEVPQVLIAYLLLGYVPLAFYLFDIDAPERGWDAARAKRWMLAAPLLWLVCAPLALAGLLVYYR